MGATRSAQHYLNHLDFVSCSGPGRISTRALSYAVVACAKANQLDEAFNIIELYRDDSSEREVISSYALNSLIAACGRVQRPDVAVQLINESQKKFRVAPDVKSYRIAIIACNQAEHREAKISTTSDAPANLDFTWWQCALSLLRRMIEDGLTPDSQTYSSVVSALESGEKYNHMLFHRGNYIHMYVLTFYSWTMATSNWCPTIYAFNIFPSW